MHSWPNPVAVEATGSFANAFNKNRVRPVLSALKPPLCVYSCEGGEQRADKMRTILNPDPPSKINANKTFLVFQRNLSIHFLHQSPKGSN